MPSTRLLSHVRLSGQWYDGEDLPAAPFATRRYLHSSKPSAVTDPRRLRALQETELLDSDAEAGFDRLTRLAARLLQAPVALVSLVDVNRQFFKSAVGLQEPLASLRETPLTHSFCQHAVESGKALIVEDATEHPLVRNNLAVGEWGVRAYAGFPLVTSSEMALGVLCVIDTNPRVWTPAQMEILADLADAAVSEIELRVAMRRLHDREAMFRALTETANDAIVTANRAGNITFWNSAAEQMFGYTPEQVLGQSLTLLMPPRYHDAHEGWLRKIAEGGATRLLGSTIEIEGVRQSGVEFPIELSLSRGSSSAGAFFTGILRDITTRRMHADALRRTEEQFRLTIDNAPIGMALVGLDGRFLRVNKALCGIVGYEADTLVTLTFQKITHPEDLDADLGLLGQLIRGEISRYQLAKRYIHQNGTTVEIMLHASVVRDRANAPIHFIAQIEDVSEKNRAAADLQHKTMILESVLEHMNDGVIVANRIGELLLVNPAAERMLGDGIDGPRNLGPKSYSLCASDGRTPLSSEEAPMARALQGAQVDQCELLVRTAAFPDGRWHSVTASPLKHKDGTVWGAVTVDRDITEAKQAEIELQAQTSIVRLLEAVAVAANEATDSSTAMQHCMRLVCEFLGWPLGHVYLVEGARLLPSDLWHLRVSDSFRAWREITARTHLVAGLGLPGKVLASGKPIWTDDILKDEISLRGRGGQALGVQAGVAFPVLVGDEVFAVLELYSEGHATPDARTLDMVQHLGTQLGRVVERERHAEAVRSLSLTDELTGLNNRRGFLALSESQLRSSVRAGKTAVLFFLDVDGLKQINDQLGHQSGDAALVALALVLRAAFRVSDIVARLGGDEFVALAPDCGADEASIILTRLQEMLTVHNLTEQRPFVLAASVGFTVVHPHNPETIEHVLRRADGLMYEQKRQKKRVPRHSVVRL